MYRTKLLIPLILGLSVLLSGCVYEVIGNTDASVPLDQTTAPEQTTVTTTVKEPFVGFAETDVKSEGELVKLQAEELEDYISEYRLYNAYHYYQHLNDSEKLVYRAYEYALDHGLPRIWVDNRLMDGMRRSELEILEFLTLDSAMVEQNINRYQGEFTVFDAVFNDEMYTSIYVEDFSKNRLRNKRNALREAQNVVYQLQGLDALPGQYFAEYFYDYLGSCVSYQEDVPNDEYLYSTFHYGKTNCDGYANAFALMCGVADIPCIEVKTDTAPGQVGHTWNIVYLDGKWVHVDATGAEDDLNSPCKNREKHRINFGFPDKLVENRMIYEDILPDCPHGVNQILYASSQGIPGFVSLVVNEFKSNNWEFAIVLLGSGHMDEQTLDELVTALNCDLQYTYHQTAKGKVVYYLFNDN